MNEHVSPIMAEVLNDFAEAQRSVQQPRFTLAEEGLADEALLALFKLRDLLVARNANSLACRVDSVMSDLERLARQAVRS